jgi:serine protease Do
MPKGINMSNILSVSSSMADMLAAVRDSVVIVESQGRGAGSGVIWRADGGILTNFHVVANSGKGLRVQLRDGRAFDATVTGTNPALDLAMLRIDADNLPAIAVDDSTNLRIGQPVWAIGHPWGQQWLVTSGIVSAIGSFKVRDTDKTVPYVRTDVRLRPGNSGGPLVNAAGQVVGINAMILGGDQAVAIPSKVAIDWLAGQPTRRVKLGVGVRPIQIEPSLARSAGVQQPTGLLVTNVQRNSLAEQASVMVGDVLLDVAGTPLIDSDDLLNALAHHSSRDAFDLKLIRGGKVQAVNVPVREDAKERWM